MSFLSMYKHRRVFMSKSQRRRLSDMVNDNSLNSPRDMLNYYVTLKRVILERILD